MRTLCDVCESAAAILFCAADEASLCRACDDKVHMCNKLASRHVRVGLAEPNEVPRCDICENAPAFFYCEVDGTSLCLQCDMIVHVGGKRTHGRYLLLRQRVEFPGDKMGTGSAENLGEAKREQPSHTSTLGGNENLLNHRVSADINPGNNYENDRNILFDLNSRPQRTSGQAQGRSNASMDNNHQSESVVPDGYYERELEK